jgi:hypothetical protein
MRKNAVLSIVIVSALALATTGCATIFRKSTQAIPVTSSPPRAVVSVNGKAVGTTPVWIRVSRRIKGQVIRIETPGYNPIEIRPRRTVVGGPVLGNFLVGLAVGFFPAAGYAFAHDEDRNYHESSAYLIWGGSMAVVGAILVAIDLGGGQGYSLMPKELNLTLTKADGPPRVDTVLIDAGRLRDIKWIRVRYD